MASTLKASFQNVQDVRADLESVQLGLGRELSAVIREAGQPLAQRAAALTPRGPGPRSPRDNLPHVAETIIASPIATGVQVVSTHPAAGWLNFGGTIRPHRNQPIRIPGHGMGEKAGEQLIGRVEQRLSERIDALLRTHGL
jgi:hypothetical protein